MIRSTRKPVVALVGATAIVMGVIVAAAGPPNLASWYVPVGKLDLRNGRQLFEKNCSGCHNIDSNEPQKSCPSLHEIGRLAATRRDHQSAAEYLMESITKPDSYRVPGELGIMPQAAVGMTDDNLRDLVAFLMSHGGSVDADQIASVLIDRDEMNETQQSIDYELVNRGAEIFRGKGGCTACHYRLSPIAPSLHGIGAKGEDYVRQSIVDPDRIVARQYAESIVELANGKVVKGWLLSCDELGAHLLSIAPEGLTKNQSITVQDIAIENIAHDDDGKLMLGTTAKSPMPSNFHTLLTPEEIDALVYFLSRLPYSYY